MSTSTAAAPPNMATIGGIIEHYQRSIERCQDDESRLLHCINKLYKLPIKVEHLKETGIGKTINSLRKFNGEIGVAAKTLVTKWKAMVAAEEEPGQNNDDELDINGDDGGGGGDSDDDQNDHKSNANLAGRGGGAEQPRQHDEKHISRSSNEKEKSSSRHKSRENKDAVGGNSSSRQSSAHHNEKTTTTSAHAISTSSSRHKTEKLEKREHEKHHKSRDRENKSERRELEKEKERSEKRKESEKKSSSHSASSHHHKSSSGGGSSSSSKRKTESSSNEQDAKKYKESSSGSKHRESEKSAASSSSSKNKEKHHSDKKTKDDSFKSTSSSSSSKDKESRDKLKSSSSSSASSKPSTSAAAAAAVSSTPSSSSSNAKKRRNIASSDDDSDSDNGSKSSPPQAKAIKVQKDTDNGGGKTSEEVDGIDSSMGANFADVLGMLNMPTKKSKKSQHNSSTVRSTSAVGAVSTSSSSSTSKSTVHSKETPVKNVATTSTRVNGVRHVPSTTHYSPDAKPDLLSSSAKLAPLDPSIALELPTISTNYKPMPLNQTVMDCVFNTSSSSASRAPVRTLTDAEAFGHGISSKTMRTKIYSGVKTGQIHQVPPLFDLCIRVLQKNVDALEYTGGVPFDVIRPVIERCTAQQLLVFEDFNPYMMEECDVLWQQHVQRTYRTQKRQEMESWREMYLRCQEDQERKLNILAQTIKQSQKIIAAPVRKTQMAFVDTLVKPPRNVQRQQVQFGTKSKMIATPAARVAALSSVTPNAAKTGDARLRVAASVRDAAQVSHSSMRPKKAPLMVKTLQFLRRKR